LKSLSYLFVTLPKYQCPTLTLKSCWGQTLQPISSRRRRRRERRLKRRRKKTGYSDRPGGSEPARELQKNQLGSRLGTGRQGHPVGQAAH